MTVNLEGGSVVLWGLKVSRVVQRCGGVVGVATRRPAEP